MSAHIDTLGLGAYSAPRARLLSLMNTLRDVNSMVDTTIARAAELVAIAHNAGSWSDMTARDRWRNVRARVLCLCDELPLVARDLEGVFAGISTACNDLEAVSRPAPPTLRALRDETLRKLDALALEQRDPELVLRVARLRAPTPEDAPNGAVMVWGEVIEKLLKILDGATDFIPCDRPEPVYAPEIAALLLEACEWQEAARTVAGPPAPQAALAGEVAR